MSFTKWHLINSSESGPLNQCHNLSASLVSSNYYFNLLQVHRYILFLDTSSVQNAVFNSFWSWIRITGLIKIWFSLGSSSPIYSVTGWTIIYTGNWRWILDLKLDFNELGNSNSTSETVVYWHRMTDRCHNYSHIFALCIMQVFPMRISGEGIKFDLFFCLSFCLLVGTLDHGRIVWCMDLA